MADKSKAPDISEFLPQNVDVLAQSLRDRLEAAKMEWHNLHMRKLSFQTSLKAMDAGTWRADKLLSGGKALGSERIRPELEKAIAQTESDLQQAEATVRVIAAELDETLKRRPAEPEAMENGAV